MDDQRQWQFWIDRGGTFTDVVALRPDGEIETAKLYDPALTRDEITDITYEITNLKAESPIMLHHLFISYSREDEAFVERVEKGLDEKRIRYWRDMHDMKAGRMERQIEKAIRMNPLVDFSEDDAFDQQFEKLVRGIVEFYPAAVAGTEARLIRPEG